MIPAILHTVYIFNFITVAFTNVHHNSVRGARHHALLLQNMRVLK